MYRKNYAWLTVLPLSLLLFCMVMTPAQATTVWSDDFGDGDYDGWTVCDGAFTVVDGALCVDCFQWATINHTSTTHTGQWSFDYRDDSVVQALSVNIIFMYSGNLSSLTEEVYGYSINIIHELPGLPGMRLVRYDGDWNSNANPGGHILDMMVFDSEIRRTWNEFDVTRDADGEINVFVNGTHYLQATDSTYDSSQYLGFSANWFPAVNNILVGMLLDDIVVTDEITVFPPTTDTTSTTGTTTTTTTTTSGATSAGLDLTLVVIGSGAAVLIITAIVFMKRR